MSKAERSRWRTTAEELIGGTETAALVLRALSAPSDEGPGWDELDFELGIGAGDCGLEMVEPPDRTLLDDAVAEASSTLSPYFPPDAAPIEALVREAAPRVGACPVLATTALSRDAQDEALAEVLESFLLPHWEFARDMDRFEGKEPGPDETLGERFLDDGPGHLHRPGSA